MQTPRLPHSGCRQIFASVYVASLSSSERTTKASFSCAHGEQQFEQHFMKVARAPPLALASRNGGPPPFQLEDCAALLPLGDRRADVPTKSIVTLAPWSHGLPPRAPPWRTLHGRLAGGVVQLESRACRHSATRVPGCHHTRPEALRRAVAWLSAQRSRLGSAQHTLCRQAAWALCCASTGAASSSPA